MDMCTMTNKTLLAELLCARFCHDLAGPIGAISNGMEFLQESDETMQAKALELMTESAFEASARLQYLRQTYGVVPADGEVDLSRLRKLATNYFHHGKISLDWPEQHTEAAGIPLSHTLSRILLNLLILSAGTIIYGGTVSVRLEKLAQGKALSVRATGKDARFEQSIYQILTGNKDAYPMDKRNVQAHLTRLLAEESHVTLHLNQGEGTTGITAQCLQNGTQYQERHTITTTEV